VLRNIRQEFEAACSFLHILGACVTFIDMSTQQLNLIFRHRFETTDGFHCRIIKTNSVAFSPQAKYADLATATCLRNLVLTFADRGVSRGQRGGSTTVINLSFLDRSRYFSFKKLLIYPHIG
jgi:hypothetical protein